jgi:hypothetical protein
MTVHSANSFLCNPKIDGVLIGHLFLVMSMCFSTLGEELDCEWPNQLNARLWVAGGGLVGVPLVVIHK